MEHAGSFWARTKRGPNGCLDWTGAIDVAGYGMARFPGGLKALAHRVAYALTFGDIPAGALVCHRCDRPICVEAAHLFLGTPKDNMADAARKGRLRSKGQGRGYLPTCANGHKRRAKEGRTCPICEARERNTRESFRVAERMIAVSEYVPHTFAELVQRIGERRALFIARNFGIYGHKPESLASIGASVGVGRERTRQIVLRGLQLLGATPLSLGEFGNVP